jgi:aminoglycoside 6'-N-acetyltransferase I
MASEQTVTIHPVEPKDTENWLAMRTALWPDTDEARHREEMATMRSDASRYAVFVGEGPDGGLIGFSEVSLREWAEGCLSSPVGYLEGWFVAPQARGRGIGRKLLQAAEEWARSRGCTEMASDTDLGNTASEQAHVRSGFQIAARVIAFRKDLRKS